LKKITKIAKLYWNVILNSQHISRRRKTKKETPNAGNRHVAAKKTHEMKKLRCAGKRFAAFGIHTAVYRGREREEKAQIKAVSLVVHFPSAAGSAESAIPTYPPPLPIGASPGAVQ
jgi:hypothetical protein